MFNSAPINLIVIVVVAVAFVRCVVVVVVIRILCTFQEINKKKQYAAQRPGKFAQNESRERNERAAFNTKQQRSA